MIAIAIFSCLQIGALLYLGVTSIRINRLKTLARNLDWVVQHQEFAEKYRGPVYWPLIVVGAILYGIIIISAVKGSMSFLLNGKYLGIFVAVFVVLAVYYLIDDRLLSAKIPLKKERAASLTRRTLQHYVHPSFILSAKATTLVVMLATLASFLIHKITLGTLLYDIIFIGFGFGLIWIGIKLGLKETIPHESDISQATNIDVGENYRKFSMNLSVCIVHCISLFTLFLLGLQLFGFSTGAAIAPVYAAWYRLFGETIPASRPLLTLEQWDILGSIISSLLFIAIATSKPVRDILSVKIKPVRQT